MRQRTQQIAKVACYLIGFGLVAALCVSACKKVLSREEGTKAPPPSPATAASTPGTSVVPASAPGPIKVLASGVNDAELAQFYHLAEGSEFVPLCALELFAAERKQTLADYFESYNLIADPPNAVSNPFGLPIGLTVSADPTRRVGFNCAACHVGRIRVDGDTLIAVGAPSSFNVRQFYDDLIPWLDTQLLHDSKRLSKVAGCMLLGSHGDPSSQGMEADFLAVSRELHERLQAKRATPSDDAELFAQLDAAADEGAVHDESKRAEDAVASSSPHFKALNTPERKSLLKKIVLEYKKRKGALLENLNALNVIREVGKLKYTPPGPGRVDAFMTALNIVNPKAKLPMTSPVAFPPLWDLSKWFHYDDNTNAIVERNIGQAIGVGAHFSLADGHADQVVWTSLRVDALESLETIMRSIQPPPSPFPARDHAQLVRGEGVYKNACGGCHDGTSPSKKPPAAAELGTDEQRLKNFAQEVDGERVIEVLSHLLGAVENAVKPKNPDSATQWNNTGRYGLRMLHGVWATAPYLHNNSVPTLADLLTAPEQRPKKFVIDYSRYDVERVGFMTLPQPTTTAPEFDTSALGNGNQGHTYGVDLSPEDKRALLTYLRQL